MIRLAVMEDMERVNELRKIVNDLHVKSRPDIFKPGFGEEVRAYAMNYLVWENNDILLCERDGVICGFAMVDYIDKPENPYNLARRFYHIAEICVDPAYRRQGVGREMMAYMEADAKKRGFDRIELDMWEFNDALSFYEAIGFRTYRRYMEYVFEDD